MSEKFFRRGLRFECHQCGNCCTFPGGAVYATEDQFRAIAIRLKISFSQFLTEYTKNHDGFVSLKSTYAGPCIFYDRGCTVYDVRPTQCRTYPFWPENLADESRWDRSGKTCAGIGTGRTWSYDEIREVLYANDEDVMRYPVDSIHS